MYFTEFIELMAPDTSLPDVLNFYTKIDEEHVTVDPEELEQRRHLVLDEDVQCQAKQFFTEDAWLGIMNTLKMLAADTGKPFWCNLSKVLDVNLQIFINLYLTDKKLCHL